MSNDNNWSIEDTLATVEAFSVAISTATDPKKVIELQSALEGLHSECLDKTDELEQ